MRRSSRANPCAGRVARKARCVAGAAGAVVRCTEPSGRGWHYPHGRRIVRPMFRFRITRYPDLGPQSPFKAGGVMPRWRSDSRELFYATSYDRSKPIIYKWRTTPWGNSLYELEVFGDSNPGCGTPSDASTVTSRSSSSKLSTSDRGNHVIPPAESAGDERLAA